MSCCSGSGRGYGYTHDLPIPKPTKHPTHSHPSCFPIIHFKAYLSMFIGYLGIQYCISRYYYVNGRSTNPIKKRTTAWMRSSTTNSHSWRGGRILNVPKGMLERESRGPPSHLPSEGLGSCQPWRGRAIEVGDPALEAANILSKEDEW
jgi:hypothetical protein